MLHSEKIKIVYVDDEPDLCEVFKDNVEDSKTEVITFTDSQLFIEQVNSIQPDLVFLDYRMPRTTGEEIAQRIDSKYPKILITGDASVKTKIQFVAVYEKPINFRELSKFIESYSKNMPLLIHPK